MPVPAFQPNAFQFMGIQIAHRIPLVIRPMAKSAIDIEVMFPMKRHKAGDEIYFQIKIRDATQLPEQLFNPVTSVKIALTSPTGASVLNDSGDMTNEALGQYGYKHQTTGAHVKGAYTVAFTVDNDEHVGATLPMLAFMLE